MSKASTRWIIKFGGSLSESNDLRIALATLVGKDVIIVPGGGPFANVVRSQQIHLGFDDDLAHRLAIHAMGLYGRVLKGLEPRLGMLTSTQPTATLPVGGHARIWLPDPDDPCLASLEASWRITSDSIATQLAFSLGVPHVLLLKSLDTAPGSECLTDASSQGIVDEALPDLVKEQGGNVKIWRTGPSGFDALAQGLEDPVSFFMRLDP